MLRQIFKTVLPVLLLGLAVAGFLYLKSTRPQASPRPASERVWPVASVVIHRGMHQPEIKVFGEVTASSVAELRPLVAGPVVAVAADFVDGAVVRKGELLLRIDPFEYEADLAERQADLAEARARRTEIQGDLRAERSLLATLEQQYQLRRRELKRQRELKTRGTASAKSRDEAELAVRAAEQALTGARQRITSLEAREQQQRAVIARLQVRLKRAERNLRDTRLSAPFDGFLDGTDVALGQRLQAGDRVARLIAAAGLEVRFQLHNRDLARLLGPRDDEDRLIGRPVQVVWRVGAEAYPYGAEIRRVGARIEASSGGVDLYARISGLHTDAPLRPGAFVEVSVPDREYPDSALVPDTALDADGRLYAIGEDGRLRAEPVTVIRRVGDRLLIRTALTEGTQVVAETFPGIGPGVRVAPR